MRKQKTEEQLFKEKLIREKGFKPMLTLVCKKCGHRQIVIYMGNNDIPCPNCESAKEKFLINNNRGIIK